MSQNKDDCREFRTYLTGPIMQTSFEPTQHAYLHQTVNLVFDLRMSSPDGAVVHKRVKMVFFQQRWENHFSLLQHSHGQ